MPIPRLRIDDATLLVIDLQERLMPTILEAETVVHHASLLVRMARTLGLPILATEQYVKGLGAPVEPLRSDLATVATVFEKTRFSGLVPEVLAALRHSGRGQVLVTGVEAHVCVLQTVLDLAAAGFVPFLAIDAISASRAGSIGPAIRRMERSGAIPTGIVSAMYELLGDASHPCFKACLPIAKEVRELTLAPRPPDGNFR
ncbi:MAG: isochorismatase family protein [Phycisphaerales bacterium]